MNLTQQQFFSSAILLGAMLSWAGCRASGGAAEFMDELVPVTGLVTVDGEPAEGVEVTFVPRQAIGGSTNHPKVQLATAVTDAEGNYSLATPQGGGASEEALAKLNGAVPGKYDATFHLWVLPDGSPDSASPEMTQGPVLVGVVEKLPPKLGNPQTSGNPVEVKAGGGNSLDFKLKTK